MIVEGGAPPDLEEPTSGMCAWGHGGRAAPQYFQICQKVGQKSAMLQGSWLPCLFQ